MTWSQDRTHMLSQLWGKFPARKISWVIFGDENHKHAVIGKAHRLGLPKLAFAPPKELSKPKFLTCRYCTFPPLPDAEVCGGCARAHFARGLA